MSVFQRVNHHRIRFDDEVSVVVLAAAGALLEDVSFVVSLCGVSWRRAPWIAMVRRSKRKTHNMALSLSLYIYIYMYKC